MKKKLLLLLAFCGALFAGIFTACDSSPEQGGTEQGGTEQGGTEQGGNEQGGTEQGGIEQGGNEQGGTEQGMTISGVTFTDKTITYDGQAHTITVTGTLPQGVSVAYSGNSGTNAGTYEATAILSGEAYRSLTLTATLTIEKATISGVMFEGDQVTYDGEAHSLQVTGVLPQGVGVRYENNGKTEAGSYTVKAILSGTNYNTLTLTATLRILPDLSRLASTVMNSFGSVPDVWKFLPESFRLNEDRAVTESATSLDFTDFVNTQNISDKSIGKQLDVVYGTVIRMQKLMGYVNTMYGGLNTIGTLYQSFINANPENYATFNGSTQVSDVTISFRITMEEKTYSLLANIGSAAVELRSYPDEARYTGRVQLSDSNALKFEAGDNSLKIGLNIAGAARTMLEFVRSDNGAVAGYLFESLDAAVAEFGTTALLTWDGTENGTVAVAGENGDFFPGSTGRVVEMYSAATGKYIAGKVSEEIAGSYDTYWFPPDKVSGLTSVKAVKKSGASLQNPHDVYVNGSSDTFVAKTVGRFGTDMFSRRYDIEMKTVYYYTYDAADESFAKVECEIPMLFVQEDYLDTFSSDVSGENDGLRLAVTVASFDVTTLDGYYAECLPAYDEISDTVTPEMVVTFIGTKDPYFGQGTQD